ncbi:MAG TPA: hypothetical protein VI603_00490 [Saprospiraceae bacterium]|nr:hypothetical protein [Saprospiraceae bacterium]
MHRLIVVILAAYYLVIATGVTMHYHYCMGKLESVTLFHPGKGSCPCGEEDEMPSCCKSGVLLLKIDKARQSEQPGISSLTVLTAVLPGRMLGQGSDKWDFVFLQFHEQFRGFSDPSLILLFHKLRI